MASTRQCLLNQFADLSVCANQNNFHKNSILVSDLRSYLFTFNLGGQSASSGDHLPSNLAACAQPFPSPPPRPSGRWLPLASLYRPGWGATAFTVTPGPSSAAQTRVNAS